METDYGNQMGCAIRAVLEMQSDCIRLFHDLDRELGNLRPIPALANLATTSLGSSINAKQLYLAEYMFRLYAPVGANHRVLGVNVCFHNRPKRHFAEPIFVAANIEYETSAPDRPEELLRTWDPWAAFLDWNTEGSFGKALEVPPQRGTIQKIIVAAVPLYSITSLEAATTVIDLVGRPS